MPKIKDVEPHILEILNNFKTANNVKNLYIWGSYAENANNPNYRVRDIDVLAKTKFNSGDLISIEEDIVKDLCSDRYLENQGYDPLAVKFSRNFLSLTKYNMDCWAISSDRKLLHWGPIITNKQESEDTSKEAEEHASLLTGKTRHKIDKTSEKTRKNWYNSYCNYMTKCFEGMPTGWYKAENIKIREITKDAIKI
jgi:hypothetical protein